MTTNAKAQIPPARMKCAATWRKVEETEQATEMQVPAVVQDQKAQHAAVAANADGSGVVVGHGASKPRVPNCVTCRNYIATHA